MTSATGQSGDGCVVYVCNINVQTEEQTVTSFFAFCGKIAAVSLHPVPDDEASQYAAIRFESRQAAATAVHLSNAMIGDRTISVVQTHPYPPPEKPSTTKVLTSSVGGVLAATIGFGRDCISVVGEQVADLDEKLLIREKVDTVKTSLGGQVSQVDEQLHVRDRVSTMSAAAAQKTAAIDEKYQIREKAATITAKTTSTVHSITAKAMDNKHVAAGASYFWSGVSALSNVVTGIHTETQQQLEQRKQLEEEQHEGPATADHRHGSPCVLGGAGAGGVEDGVQALELTGVDEGTNGT